MGSLPLTSSRERLVARAEWLWECAMPQPKFPHRALKAAWSYSPHSFQWHVRFKIRRGWLPFLHRIEQAKLYLIPQNFGPLDSPPEPICLKWIEDGTPLREREASLRVGNIYEAIVLVRNEEEGTAYIADEMFIDTAGHQKMWPLLPGGLPLHDGPIGRYTFWLEIRAGKHIWRSPYDFVVEVPPAGPLSDAAFKLQLLERGLATQPGMGPPDHISAGSHTGSAQILHA